MNKNRKAEAGHFGSKTNDYFADNQKTFSSSDYSEELETIQSFILNRVNPKPKVIRCYRCLACHKHYSATRMSNVLILCRHCYRTAGDKGNIARRNMIERIKNQVGMLLRKRLEIV